MPLTLRPKDDLLAAMVSTVLAGNLVTDMSPISVTRQLLEGAAADLADLTYDLYNLVLSFYMTTASAADLDTRGRDYGLVRDPGQAASDSILFTGVATWVEDILLPAPQVLQAFLADGSLLVYRSLGDTALLPQGRSISAPGGGTVLVGGSTDQIRVNLDGDGVRTLTLGSQPTGTAIAAALQTAVRALTANSGGNQTAYTGFRADYSVTTPGCYTLRSGAVGETSTMVVTPGVTHDATAGLKLGLANGGTEMPGMTTLSVPVLADVVGVQGNIGVGQLNTQATPVAGVLSVGNPLMFSNGREPASDDAYRQDLRSYLKAQLGGTRYLVERTVLTTPNPSDGQRHVLSAQVLSGPGQVQVYVCDGRSLTVGAQADVVQDVQDNLDGLGAALGGVLPCGTVAGVAPATVLPVSFALVVTVGPTPDLLLAQSTLQGALYALTYLLPVGEALAYWGTVERLNQAVVDILDVSFTLPVAFSTTPPTVVGGGLGIKVMPSTISVEVVRG